MIKKQICPVCGQAFVTDAPHKKYCSLICADAGRKKHRQEWNANHPTYNQKYMRAYRQRLKRKQRGEQHE